MRVPPPGRDEVVLSTLAVVLALLLAASGAVGGFLLDGILAGVLGLFAGLLRRLPEPIPGTASLPLGFFLLALVLSMPASLASLGEGAAAGLLTLLFVALPSPRELPLAWAGVLSEFLLPVVACGIAVASATVALGLRAPILVVWTPFLLLLALFVLFFGLATRPARVPPAPERG
jgi:hypothetical protein